MIQTIDFRWRNVPFPYRCEGYVRAATAKMPRKKQIEIAARLLELARKEAAS